MQKIVTAKTPLYMACEMGHENTVRVLVLAGAHTSDINREIFSFSKRFRTF